MVRKTTKKTGSESTDPVPQVEKKFLKSDLMKAKAFTKIEADFLGAFLAEESYTLEEAKKELSKLRKEQVK
ncbi:hypothetical protein FQS90_00150 [Enterococcus casseliflavus]|uniref:hypothetical protein n=1 Tax=unclassified Enterococcus TaxID=2608891 RepID=UPI000B3EC446|nr:hypothetical protein [Enterococcus sp. 8E11_MSG4843]MBO1094961.1 hypothetical protein [Enterococcus casseliflavus]MBO1143389.1 hypothetical protein [Enterococcus casseliflavus]MBV6371332.1 hypothetical protein [Enterococcus casseliflavus]OUZ32508.1 hypothetical protein A5885_002788 [Enterococcus sp. 8E11_MSG4843]